MTGLRLPKRLRVVSQIVRQPHHTQVVGGGERLQPLPHLDFELDLISPRHNKNHIPPNPSGHPPPDRIPPVRLSALTPAPPGSSLSGSRHPLTVTDRSLTSNDQTARTCRPTDPTGKGAARARYRQ